MNYHKGFTTPVLLIVAILVIGGGIYGYQAYRNTAALPLPPAQTSGWKTYTNTTYGFQIMYPSDYTADVSAQNVGLAVKTAKGCEGLNSRGGNWPANCYTYDVRVQDNKISSEGQGLIKSTVTVAGISAEVVTHEYAMWDNMTTRYVQFQKGGKWYIQSFAFNTANAQAAEKTSDQILATFKFTP